MKHRFSIEIGAIAVIFGSYAVFAKKSQKDVDVDIALPTTNRMLSLGQLSEQFQLLSQYSFGNTEECADLFRMTIPQEAQADFESGIFDLPYSKISIEAGADHGDEAVRKDSQISCRGPDSNNTLTLQAGRTVSAAEFLRRHLHSSSTITLFETLVPRLQLGNFWLSEPAVPPFTCASKGNGAGKTWFSERFTFVFFCEEDDVPVSFIGKVRPDGSERLVHLSLTGTIRYFIATAPQSTCIYRSVTDVERLEREKNGKDRNGNNNNNTNTTAPSVPAAPSGGTSTNTTTTTNTTEECHVQCDALAVSGNSFRGNSLSGVPWFTPLSQKDPSRERRWLKSSHKAPYAPRPVTTGESGFSTNPIYSWRSTWFWCSHPSSNMGNNLADLRWSGNFNGERACFPSSSMVESLERGPIHMDSVRIGEQVRAGTDGQFSRVFMFSHKDENVWNPFVTLSTESGLSLTLSPGHILPLSSGKLVRADEIVVGHSVITNASNDDAVTRTRRVRKRGLYNPHTLSGSILVDGVLASCYTSEVQPSVAHALLAPVRSLFLSSSVKD